MAIAIFERWGLNPREQKVATVALFVLAGVLLLAIPVGLSMLVSAVALGLLDAPIEEAGTVAIVIPAVVPLITGLWQTLQD